MVPGSLRPGAVTASVRHPKASCPEMPPTIDTGLARFFFRPVVLKFVKTGYYLNLKCYDLNTDKIVLAFLAARHQAFLMYTPFGFFLKAFVRVCQHAISANLDAKTSAEAKQQSLSMNY